MGNKLQDSGPKKPRNAIVYVSATVPINNCDNGLTKLKSPEDCYACCLYSHIFSQGGLL